MARPKRQFSDEELQKIDEMAQNNCHMDTIALALDIPLTTLVRRFGREIKQKRALGRTELRQTQVKLSKTQAAMAIFLGKNELNQTDKQEITDKPIDSIPLTVEEIKELKRLAGLTSNIKLKQPESAQEAG